MPTVHLAQMRAMALEAMEHAYAPYSTFKVGVCLESLSGQFFTGCNIENASYSLTLCAESTAIAAMVNAGEQSIKRLVLVSSGDGFCSPCGACRQRLLEFADSALDIYLFNPKGELQQHSLQELLPHSFAKKDLPVVA